MENETNQSQIMYTVNAMNAPFNLDQHQRKMNRNSTYIYIIEYPTYPNIYLWVLRCPKSIVRAWSFSRELILSGKLPTLKKFVCLWSLGALLGPFPSFGTFPQKVMQNNICIKGNYPGTIRFSPQKKSRARPAGQKQKIFGNKAIFLLWEKSQANWTGRVKHCTWKFHKTLENFHERFRKFTGRFPMF